MADKLTFNGIPIEMVDDLEGGDESTLMMVAPGVVDLARRKYGRVSFATLLRASEDAGRRCAITKEAE